MGGRAGIVCGLMGVAALVHGQSPPVGPFGADNAALLKIAECEGSSNDCSSWLFRGSSGNGQWGSGAIANLQVVMAQGDSLVIRRTDTFKSSTPGLTAVYKGTLHGSTIDGTVTWTRATGAPTSGSWHASITLPAPVAAEPVAPQVAAVSDVSAATGSVSTTAAESRAAAPVALDTHRIPVGLQECDGNQCDAGNGNLGIWIFHGRIGEAHWPSGAIAKLEIEQYNDEGVVIRRTDTANSGSPGFTAVYQGEFRDGKIVGTVDASWPGHFPKSRTPGYINYPFFASVPQTSCEAGEESTQTPLEVGQNAVKFGQPKAGLQCFMIAAKQGDGQARSWIGLMYRDGIGTEINYPEAFRWLKAAAIQGDYNAQLALSQMYDVGIGTQPDRQLAQSWKQQAENNPVILRQRQQAQERQQQAQERQQQQQLMFLGFAAVLEAVTRPDVIVVY